MPIVRVELWSGSSREFKTDLAKAITDVVVEKVGCPVEAVTVKIDESPMENWVIGGKPAPEMHKE
jgi:4-oxalocrotonate tautomerase